MPDFDDDTYLMVALDEEVYHEKTVTCGTPKKCLNRGPRDVLCTRIDAHDGTHLAFRGQKVIIWA